MPDEPNASEKKNPGRTAPLTRKEFDEAERPGGAYISGDRVVDANGDPIEGLVVGPDGSIHQARG